jgi:hypothetical protein
MPGHSQSRSSLAISLALHLLLLFILGLLHLSPLEIPRWHEFEWLSPDPPEQAIPAEQSLMGSDAPAADIAASHPVEAASAPLNPAVKPITSPLIETPVLGDQSAEHSAPVQIDHAAISGALHNVGNVADATGTAYGYNASLVSGSSEAYIIRQSPPKINPMMDDEVLIEFRLSESGRVLMNTVSVLSYKQSAHWEAIRTEMPSWRFGFKSRYNADRLYRIRVVFRVY